MGSGRGPGSRRRRRRHDDLHPELVSERPSGRVFHLPESLVGAGSCGAEPGPRRRRPSRPAERSPRSGSAGRPVRCGAIRNPVGVDDPILGAPGAGARVRQPPPLAERLSRFHRRVVRHGQVHVLPRRQVVNQQAGGDGRRGGCGRLLRGRRNRREVGLGQVEVLSSQAPHRPVGHEHGRLPIETRLEHRAVPHRDGVVLDVGALAHLPGLALRDKGEEQGSRSRTARSTRPCPTRGSLHLAARTTAHWRQRCRRPACCGSTSFRTPCRAPRRWCGLPGRPRRRWARSTIPARQAPISSP